MHKDDYQYVHNRYQDAANDPGRVAFSVGPNGFVAFQRGFNWFTRRGSTEPWDLAKSSVNTMLPGGTYCNMALENAPAPAHCQSGDTVEVAENGTVVRGRVMSGWAVVLHKRHQLTTGQSESARLQILSV